MPNIGDNLLLNLHRLATGQDENFVTESFVHLLRYLSINEKEAFLEVINRITEGMLRFSFEDLQDLQITSQVATDEGIPDIEICSDKYRIFIEVKVESGFGPGQLEGYKKILDGDYRYPNSCLTVLTKYPVVVSKDSKVYDTDIRWLQMGEWMEQFNLKNSVAAFQLDQFITFLKGRGLAMETISWELVNGLKSFRNLIAMLGEVLAANRIEHAKSVGYEYHGYHLDNAAFFIGLLYETPHLLLFQTNGTVYLRENEAVQFGSIVNNKWRFELDMHSEEHYFFSRSKASQMECIDQFLKKSHQYAKTLTG